MGAAGPGTFNVNRLFRGVIGCLAKEHRYPRPQHDLHEWAQRDDPVTCIKGFQWKRRINKRVPVERREINIIKKGSSGKEREREKGSDRDSHIQTQRGHFPLLPFNPLTL